MTKFEIMTDTFELRPVRDMSAGEVFDSYMNSCLMAEKREASFDTIEEAQAEFAKNYSNYGRTHVESGSAGRFLWGRVAWIAENEYDEDGEFDQGGDVWAFSAQPYISEEEDEEEDE